MAQSHAVYFYEDDAALVERAIAYVEAGLQAGGSVIAIVRTSFLVYLKSRWLPAYQHRFIGLDAGKTLSSFMVDGKPDRKRFMEGVGSYVAEAAKLTPHVYAVGEMVTLLWEQHNLEGALQLEDLWNELCGRHRLTLLCGYPIGATADPDCTQQLTHRHSETLTAHSHLSAPAP